jgi:peptidyl-prolyl cis-trans isomerase A (cyclophilin A)
MLQRCLAVMFILTLAAAGQTTTKKSTKSQSSSSSSTKKSTSPGTSSSAHPTAILHTSAGDMKCELFPDKAPLATSNFIGLASGTKDWTDPNTGKLMHGKPLYDGTIFHRVIPEFMIQGGDAAGNGSGNPGYKFNDELHPDVLFDKPGRLAMANSGPNTNGSQFFITEKEVPFLNPCYDEGGCMNGRRAKGSGYTIFGQCDDNTVALVKQIARMPKSPSNPERPLDPVKINHIEIQKAGAASKPSTKTGTGSKKTTTKKSATPKQ